LGLREEVVEMRTNGTLEEAAEFARELHSGQTRKGTTEPYFNHLVGTVEVASRYGATEVEKMGAVLHDAVEDYPRGGATERSIRRRFGAEVLGLVMGCTNTYGNKMLYAAHLATAPPGVALVAASDKLYNAISIVKAHGEVGEKVFERFVGGEKSVKAYYRAVTEALKPKVPPGLAAELEVAVSAMERL
jgi:(p)ppGpp synthase/HD superfamily hydrolase